MSRWPPGACRPCYDDNNDDIALVVVVDDEDDIVLVVVVDDDNNNDEFANFACGTAMWCHQDRSIPKQGPPGCLVHWAGVFCA